MPREVGGPRTTSRRPDPQPPDDPWVPGGPPSPPTSSAPEPARTGPFPSAGISPTGELTFREATWTTASVPEGYELARYAFGALAPASGQPAPALPGIPEEAPEPQAGPDPGWAELAEALVEAVGRDRWPPADTLLAWDAKHAALCVQQDAEGHARVAELLTRRAADRLDALRLLLEVEATDAEAADRLTIDVPWGRSVRAHHGAAWAYLADYDVEIGQSCPCVLPLDTGLGVSARRIAEGAGRGALDVDVAASWGLPLFDRFETTLAFSAAVTIEIPRLDIARWRGRVPAGPGKHRIELDDGRVATLVVQASRPGPRPDPAFVRHVLAPPQPRSPPPGARGPGRLVVTWLAPGPLQGRTMTVPLVGYGDGRDGPPAEGWCAMTTRGLMVDPLELANRECPWPMPEGGVRIHAAAFTAGNVDVLDLVVDRCDVTSDTRDAPPCLRQDWTSGEVRTWYEPLALPVCRMRVDARRLTIPVGREAWVHLDDDTGATFRVTLPREE